MLPTMACECRGDESGLSLSANAFQSFVLFPSCFAHCCCAMPTDTSSANGINTPSVSGTSTSGASGINTPSASGTYTSSASVINIPSASGTDTSSANGTDTSSVSGTDTSSASGTDTSSASGADTSSANGTATAFVITRNESDAAVLHNTLEYILLFRSATTHQSVASSIYII